MRSKKKREVKDTQEEKKIRRKKKVLTKGWVVWIIFFRSLRVTFFRLAAFSITCSMPFWLILNT